LVVVAYLGTRGWPDGRLYGAILAVDELGLPVEFKHTEPVAPAGLVAALHGRKLDWHLKLNVIGAPLISALGAQAAAVICDEAVYLKLQPKVKPPLVLVSQTTQQPLPESGKAEDVGQGRFLVSLSPTESPYILTPAEGQEKAIPKIAEAMTAIAKSISILEPMDRLAKALEIIASERNEHK